MAKLTSNGLAEYAAHRILNHDTDDLGRIEEIDVVQERIGRLIGKIMGRMVKEGRISTDEFCEWLGVGVWERPEFEAEDGK